MEKPSETNGCCMKPAGRTLCASYPRLLILFLILCFAGAARAQNPVADFNANITSGCSPVTVQFRDQSTGNPVFWNWDLGNGQLSTLQNPVATYSTPGNYTITLVVRNANGISSVTKTDFIVVNPSPTAGVTADKRLACVPATIQFTDASLPRAGTIISWDWDFGDGTKSNLQNPSKTYNATGFYTVTLKVTSSTGCTSTASYGNFIRVVSGVTADFSFQEPLTCRAPFLINFTDLTSGPGNITYAWNFGDGNTATLQNPSNSYVSAGNYTVQLTATSEYGCSATVQKPVTVVSNTASFTAPDTVCLNSTVSFQNTSTPTPLSNLWDFGNSKQSTKLSDTSSYDVPGTFQVRLINNYSNCTDSFVRNIVVSPPPAVDFTAPQVIGCKAPFTVNFQSLAPTAVSWQWDFGDGATSNVQNPTHQYNTPGQYNVRLTITDARGCSNTVSKSNFVRIIAPTVAISNAPSGGCAPFTFNPVASVNAIDGIASYFWDFGDGFTATGASPSHTYVGVGSYTIKLVITTNGGCTDSAVYNQGIRVGNPSFVDFTASLTDVCAFSPVTFVPDPSMSVDGYFWQFGDGTNSSLANPSHPYSDTGRFNVTLTGISNGCPASVTKSQYIHVKPPIAKFNFSVSCVNKRQVSFTNTAVTDGGYGPISYLWEFGDPSASTSTLPNPGFTYPATGPFTVKLTVTNGSCSHTVSKTIDINSDFADFVTNKSTVCRNELFILTATNSSPANISRYEWSFDGGPFQNLGNPVTTSFAVTGPHNISLRITDVNGCQDTKTYNGIVTVFGPKADFSISNPNLCKNTSLTFNDLSTTSGTSIASWIWDFGDGKTQTFSAPPFNHTYQDTGLFSVSLKVVDQNGCSDVFTQPVKIFVTQPLARFGSQLQKICQSTNLQFSDSSTGYRLSYLWSFGDGNTSALQNPVHQYTGNDSIYTVKLVVTDSIGCSDSSVKLNYIMVRKPKPAFSIKDTSTICPPLETKFTFLGQDYESFYWDFGDGSTSTLTNPNHFYNTYGSFVPKLYLTGYGGCIDSASATVNVYNAGAVASINYSPLNACNSLLVDFTITVPPSTRFTFQAGDGFSDTSQTRAFQHLYKTFGYYTPTIVITDSFKCAVGLSGSNIIRILGAEPLFGLDKKAFCDTGTVLFANYTIGNDPIVNTLWDFGDGNTSGVTDPAHRYTTPGTYLPSLTVTTQAGCSKTLTDTVRVYGTPNPTISGDTIVCINELLPLQGLLAVPDTAITWAWTLGNGNTASSQNTTTRYGTSGRFTQQLTATNKLGCKGTTTHPVFVPPNPVITVTTNPVIPVGTSISLPVSYSPNISIYTWTPPAQLSCTDCPVPVANPKSTTKYKIQVEDIYGCTASNEVTVTVVCNEKNYFVPNTFSPNNDGVNDRFYPRGSGLTRVQSMRVFNRWGEMIFERTNFLANDASLGWDGTMKGKPANMDTYVYIVEFVCDNSVIIPVKGNVTLIR